MANEEGDDSDPGLASRRDCGLTATARRPEAVGWALIKWQARWLLPFGDCGSVVTSPLTTVERTKGRRPQNRPRDKGG